MKAESTEKLQKVLARAGYGSRRALERWITDGRISVNGKRALPGMRVGARDNVLVDGKRLSREARRRQPVRVLRYHKPVGELCSRSRDQGRSTVFDHLPRIKSGRWIVVGRLDINSSGLLLFTNDGELVHRLMHPSSELQREYAVRVHGAVSDRALSRLRRGVRLSDGPAKFESIVDKGGQGANHWYHVTLHEGRNREVRRLWESQHIEVSRLIRVQFGPVSLPRRLARGRWEELSERQTSALLEAAGLDSYHVIRDS